MLRRPLLLALAVTLAGGHAAHAAQEPKAPGERPNVDVRDDGRRAAAPPAARDARRRLADRFGRAGRVETDARTGALRRLARIGGELTEPGGGDAAGVALRFARANADVLGVARGAIDGLELVRRDRLSGGATVIQWAQEVDGLLTYDSGLKAVVAADGRLLELVDGPVAGLDVPSGAPRLDAGEALAIARRDAGGSGLAPRGTTEPGPARRTTFGDVEAADLLVLPTEGGGRRVWRVVVEGRSPHAFETLVDADSGSVLKRRSLTEFLRSARVFRRYPGAPLGGTAQDLTMQPGGDASWLSDTAGGTRLWGNNGRAYADRNNNNAPESDEQVPATNASALDWLRSQTLFTSVCANCTWNSASSTSESTNRHQAGTNLFWLANDFHDWLLQPDVGFGEASRNFEEVNSSGQGLGGDGVVLETNDGGGLNNANMLTPPDGQRPRMQMYLWNSPDVNSSDDASVVAHEYTHGLSNRLVVNAAGSSTLNGAQARGMGEGWSDWYAIDYLQDRGLLVDGAAAGDVVLGEYVTGDPRGIRVKPMDCRTTDTTAACGADGGWTFGDLPTRAVPHGVGEVWSQTLWDLRRALGAGVARRLVTNAMRLAPADPNFLHMRDAIVLADDAEGGSRYDQIWQVFAARGMGFSAVSPGTANTGVTEAFDLPNGLSLVSVLTPDPGFADGGDADGAVEPGETVSVLARVRNASSSQTRTGAGTLSSADPALVVRQGTTSWTAVPPRAERDADGPLRVELAPGASCERTRRQLSLRIEVAGASPQTVAVPVLTGLPADRLFPGPSAAPGLSIPDNNPAGVTHTITVPAGTGTVGDVNVRIDELRHTWVGDLRIELSHGGTTVVVANRPGGNNNDGDDLLNTAFDDEAAALPPPGGAPYDGRFRPVESLAAFDGQAAEGTWTLRVSDLAGQDTGRLERWGLNFSGAAPCPVTRPNAETRAATGVSSTAATLTGAVTPGGAPTGYRFVYGTTPAYGSATPAVDAGAGDSAVNAAAAVGGLQPDTLYHFRVEALRGGAPAVVGADATFRTPPTPGTDASMGTGTDASTGTGTGSGTGTGTGSGAGGVASSTSQSRVLLGTLRTIRLTRGRFRFGFRAAPRAVGTAELSILQRRRRVRLARLRWRADTTGRVAVRGRLGRTALRRLRGRRRVRAVLAVTTGGRTTRANVTLRR